MRAGLSICRHTRQLLRLLFYTSRCNVHVHLIKIWREVLVGGHHRGVLFLGPFGGANFVPATRLIHRVHTDAVVDVVC